MVECASVVAHGQEVGDTVEAQRLLNDALLRQFGDVGIDESAGLQLAMALGTFQRVLEGLLVVSMLVIVVLARLLDDRLPYEFILFCSGKA